jgi:hypothetical protein
MLISFGSFYLRYLTTNGMKLRVMMKMSQWRCAPQPLQQPLIIKHQPSRKKEAREVKGESLWGRRLNRPQQRCLNLLW